MATINKKGMVSGTAGSLVYRQYRGKNIIQSKPRKYKQTEDSIRASTEFGLSSSTAAVIRRAFEEAYVHRDGEAASRSTQLVYRSIRSSSTGLVGKRDLHDADLSVLQGLEFNTNSKLGELIPLSTAVCELSEQGVRIKMKPAGPLHTLKKPAGVNKAADMYRIRLTIIGFNFREEYYEYLGVQDIDLRGRESIQEQIVQFDCGPRPDLLILVSMSILAYKETSMKDGLVLLNSKEFSPCAIIGAFPAEEPGDYPEGPVNHDFAEEMPGREGSLHVMGYDGNRLILGLPAKLMKSGKRIGTEKIPEVPKPTSPVGKRVSFKR